MMNTDNEYPDHPGFKVTGTSQDAAIAIAAHAKTVRAKVWACIQSKPNGVTADEIAEALHLSVLTVRPRVSELRRQGLIEPTGERFCNSSGMTANAWREV